ncbi:hypothetical protein BS47DRAFT_1206394 [Hydnum rufescens UP504]|uniref:Uncharacterized protein n=1 Tax=Hydnum rufescens UP504 TaxID=1448309 RepID=A0A9P6DTX0_9AGAM|nr:hypothetical protein BS47DRAFT_1206394 [Hydnum rufescens UP504]
MRSLGGCARSTAGITALIPPHGPPLAALTYVVQYLMFRMSAQPLNWGGAGHITLLTRLSIACHRLPSTAIYSTPKSKPPSTQNIMSNHPSPASSTAHLIQKSSQKDYSAALSSLQDSYGFGGSPVIPNSFQGVHRETTTTPTSAPSPSRPKIRFTSILTSLGFGGGSSPNPPTTSKPSPLSSSPTKRNFPTVQNASQMAVPAAKK